MIYERWGAPVKVLGGDLNMGEAHVRTLAGDYEERRYKIGFLRADGGFAEIHDAVLEANAHRETP